MTRIIPREEYFGIFLIPPHRLLERIAEFARNHEIDNEFAHFSRHAFRIKRETALCVSSALFRPLAGCTIAALRKRKYVAEESKRVAFPQIRHGRACPGHPRLSDAKTEKAWMPGTRPGMTNIQVCIFSKASPFRGCVSARMMNEGGRRAGRRDTSSVVASRLCRRNARLPAHRRGDFPAPGRAFREAHWKMRFSVSRAPGRRA
jgi:hypothetical protein